MSEQETFAQAVEALRQEKGLKSLSALAREAGFNNPSSIYSHRKGVSPTPRTVATIVYGLGLTRGWTERLCKAAGISTKSLSGFRNEIQNPSEVTIDELLATVAELEEQTRESLRKLRRLRAQIVKATLR